jgi:hypothetical protein
MHVYKTVLVKSKEHPQTTSASQAYFEQITSDKQI